MIVYNATFGGMAKRFWRLILANLIYESLGSDVSIFGVGMLTRRSCRSTG